MAEDACLLFNRKLDDFVEDLIAGFPMVPDFRVLKKAVSMSQLMQPSLPQTVFDQVVAQPYEAFILKRDEQFFLQEQYDKVINQVGGAAYCVDLDIIEKLKVIWKNLDPSNKEAIWQHLHGLLHLNRACKQASLSRRASLAKLI